MKPLMQLLGKLLASFLLAALLPASASAQAAGGNPASATKPESAGTLPGPVAGTPSPRLSSQPVTLDGGYVLGNGDIVDIAVLGREEFKPRVQIQVDGTVQLPYLHSVAAANLTVLQLREKVAQLLRDGGYYVDPVVSVNVVSYASRYVTVLGEFGSPGLLPVDRSYRVSEILARAGGAKSTAGDDLILRRADGQQFVLPISKVSSGGLAEDPMVQPGDKLFIDAAPTFYIYGQVTAAGSYKVDKAMTVRMALARGGGLTDRGSANRISIFRDGKKLKANLDLVIRGGDTIVVGERFF